MATITTGALPSGTFSAADQVVGNQSGSTKRLTLNVSGLADFESGSWTPTLYGATTAGTTTYSVRNGGYRKMADVCHCTFEVSWTAHTGSGIVLIGGLPFTCANQSGDIRFNVGISDYTNLNLATGERIGGYVRDSFNYILMLGNEMNNAASLLMTNLNQTGTLRGSFTYWI